MLCTSHNVPVNVMNSSDTAPKRAKCAWWLTSPAGIDAHLRSCTPELAFSMQNPVNTLNKQQLGGHHESGRGTLLWMTAIIRSAIL